MNKPISAPSALADESASEQQQEWLDAERIAKALSATGLTVEVHKEIDSTNRALAGRRHRHRHLVMAEYQQQGRGRRGRSWTSPPASGLCMSFGYRFGCSLDRLGPLSLALGIAVAECLRAFTRLNIQLKWPNDIMYKDQKLGGVLVELQSNADGQSQAIVGLGLNITLPDQVYQSAIALEDAASGRGWTDLYRALNWAKTIPLRNELSIELSSALDQACLQFDQQGFDAFAQRWPSLDCLAGKTIQAAAGDGSTLVGVAEGISPSGGLWLNAGSKRVQLQAAEVSVRQR